MKNVIKNLEIVEMNENIIEKEKLFNVYVFGLPRSGTSMTTKILELLGVNMIYTSEEHKEKTDERIKKKFGEYHPNEKGFYEITTNPFFYFLKILSKPYSGCKMIIPVMGMRWDIVRTFPSKVIIAKRHAEEIRQSQMAYYRKDNIKTSVIYSLWANEEERLKKLGIPFIETWYNNFLEEPEREINKIKKFIRSDTNINEALNSIDPNQNRFKKNELIEGI